MPKNEKGSTILMVLVVLAIFTGVIKLMMGDKESANRAQAIASRKLKYNILHTELKEKFFTSSSCKQALAGTIYAPTVDATTGIFMEKGIKLRVDFAGQTPQGPGGIIDPAGNLIQGIRISDIVAVEVQQLTPLSLGPNGSDISGSRNSVRFMRQTAIPTVDLNVEVQAFSVNVYILPQSMKSTKKSTENPSGYYSLGSEDFKSKFAIPIVIYVAVRGVDQGKIVNCFGAGSAGDVCTRMGGSFVTETPVTKNIRCQPDLFCLGDPAGVIYGDLNACATRAPFTTTRVLAPALPTWNPPRQSMVTCSWCYPVPVVQVP